MASTSSLPAAASAPPRYDFYQTETVVNVSVFIKQARKEDVAIDIAERSLRIRAHSAVTDSEHILVVDPLFAAVDAASSSFKVLGSKIDVVLHKARPGHKWQKLEAVADNVELIATPKYADSHPAPQTSISEPSAAPRAKSKWDSFDPDEDDGTGSGANKESEADINEFFKRIYADANEDTKRAMLKSYQESGGTTLSTDWSKVGQGKVETVAPNGMEARKWGA